MNPRRHFRRCPVEETAGQTRRFQPQLKDQPVVRTNPHLKTIVIDMAVVNLPTVFVDRGLAKSNEV